jgi:hypothetical protein
MTDDDLTDISFDEPEPAVCHEWLNIMPVTRSEIIETSHHGTFGQQSLDQIGTNESGAASY